MGVNFRFGNLDDLAGLLFRRSDLDRFTELNIPSSRLIALSRYFEPMNDWRFVSTQLPIFIYNSYWHMIWKESPTRGSTQLSAVRRKEDPLYLVREIPLLAFGLLCRFQLLFWVYCIWRVAGVDYCGLFCSSLLLFELLSGLSGRSKGALWSFRLICSN
jgi:hypothetical protein